MGSRGRVSIGLPGLIMKHGVSEEEFYRLADEDSDGEYPDGRIILQVSASNPLENLFCFLLTLLRRGVPLVPPFDNRCAPVVQCLASDIARLISAC